MWAMELHGREALLARLREVSSRVLILSGDSGVGKSEVLRGLDSGWAVGTVVPGARLLGSTAGSLQATIIDQLSEVLSIYSDSHPHAIQDIRAGLVRLLDRVSSATAHEFRKLLMARVLGAVKGKFGDEVSDLVKEVAPELFSKSGNPLSDRLTGMSRPDTASEVLALAGDIAALVDAKVVLRLDQAEVLSAEDLALLGELASRDLEEVRLLVAFSTADPDSGKTLARLELRGASRVTINGLDRGGLETWFVAESVPPQSWASIERISNGYPFFVRDAIALTREGTPLQSLPTPGGFESLLRLRWHSMDPKIQVLAMQLSAFRDPPDEGFLRDYLSLGDHEWVTVRNALQVAGVFVERPDGTVWFHDRRRNYIWDSLMDDRSRLSTANAALAHLRTWQASQQHVFTWVISSLLPLVAVTTLEAEPESILSRILDLDRAELCVLFALIEVVEPKSESGQFSDTGEVVAYAVSKFGEPLDPVKTIESLRERGLIVVASNDRASIVGLVVSEALAYPTLLAALEDRLGRMPVPRFASTMFDYALRPVLGAFVSASMSLGEGDMRRHRFSIEELRKKEVQDRGLIRSLPGLGVITMVEGQHFSSSILFESEDDRQRSLDRLRDLQASTAGPLAPVIVSLVKLPPRKLPSARYGELQKLVKGLPRDPVTNAAGLVESLSRRVATIEALRGKMSEAEASAFGMKHPRRLLVDFEDIPGRLSWVEFAVSGPETRPDVQLIPIDNRVDAHRDPLLELKFRRDGLIGATERIVSWTTHSSVPLEVENPLVDAVKGLTDRAREFNRSLSDEPVALDAAMLESKIRAERDIQIAMLRDLRDQRLVNVEDRETTFSIHVEIWPESDLAWGFGWMAQQFDIDDGLNRIEVKMLESRPPSVDLWEISESDRITLGLGNAPIVRTTRGIATSIVGELLGFGMSDFHIWDPERMKNFRDSGPDS